MAEPVEIWTDFDLRSITSWEMPAEVLKSIALAYREERAKTILSKKQMHDLSPMIPLRQTTIDHKKGVHKTKQAGKLAVKAQAIKGWRDIRKNVYVWGKRQRVKVGTKAIHGKVGYISQYPDVPLVDTGNLLYNTVNHIEKGTLTITIGTTREKIAGYHQEGSKTKKKKTVLPRRVHHSWNNAFVEGRMTAIIWQYMNEKITDGSNKMMRRAS